MFEAWIKVGVVWPAFCNRCGCVLDEGQVQEYPEGSGLAFCSGCLPKEVAMQQAPLSIAALNIGDIKSLGSQAA